MFLLCVFTDFDCIQSQEGFVFFFQGNDVLALSVGGATAGCRSDHPALDGNRNIMSCWDGSSHYSSAFAKLLWEVVFITPVRETILSKIDNM